MAILATPARRRMAMAALLVLAVSGGVIRYLADDPSTLRDIGTLLLVLWLPAIGNLIGYLARKLPRGAPPPTDFAAGSDFVPHLHVQLEPVQLPPDALKGLAADVRNGTLLVGRRGFTVRMDSPYLRKLARSGIRSLALELLTPAAALPHLPEGTRFHLLIGVTAVAKGTVLRTNPLPSNGNSSVRPPA
jgi:hypothetical protein